VAAADTLFHGVLCQLGLNGIPGLGIDDALMQPLKRLIPVADAADIDRVAEQLVDLTTA